MMNRRSFLTTVGSGLLIARERAILGQVETYPGVRYRDYFQCLPDYLSAAALEAYERRNRRVSALTDRESIESYQRWARETLWELIGGEPERKPLKVKKFGAVERPGFKMEKLTYESRPGLVIAANLYLPTEGSPPYPGVLFQMGHSLNGKAAATYQRCCQALARLGFVVLAFDPMGQGERTYYPGDDGYLTRLGSADEEHSRPGRQMLLIGDTSTRLQLWDAVRSLDYLASHPWVDPERLASTGQSGGGTLTMLLAAVDERLAAAAVACGNTENFACRDFNAPGSTDDAEQNLPGSARRAFDRWDLLYPLAPKPLLVLVSDRDFFGTYSPRYRSSGWEEFEKLRKVYRVLGAGDRLHWSSTPMPHNLSYELRLEIYNWLRRWLQRREDPVDREPATRVEEDRVLWCGSTGNVVADFGSETPFSLNLARFEKLSPGAKRGLQSLLSIDALPAEASFQLLGRSPSGEVTLEVVEVQSDEQVWVPAYLFLPPAARRNGRLLLLFEPAGRNARWREDQLCQQLAGRGTVVCTLDVRNAGDLRPEYGRGAPHYAWWHQDEEQYGWSGLILGRPLVGQRVVDLLSVVSALRQRESFRGLELRLAAAGSMTVPAVFAARLCPEIEKLYLSGGLASFRSIIESPDYAHPFSNFVPDLLLETDLPQLVDESAARTTLAGMVDAAGETLTAGEVRSLHPGQEVEVTAEARWDVESLDQL